MVMLKRHRLVKGLTLRELARRIGVTATACSNWETGRHRPNARTVPKLARALNLDPMELTLAISPDAK